LALLAAVLVFQYLNEADDRAEEKIEQVEVFVAAKTIPKGMPGDQALAENLIEQVEYSRKDVPASAIESTDQITGRVAAAEIAEGLPIVENLFVLESEAGGIAPNLSDGEQAITISVDPEKGVANWISPGDNVNLILSIDLSDKTAANTPTGKVTAFLLPGIEVMSVGTTTVTSTPQEGEPAEVQNSGLLTLRVNARQAEQIAHAKYLGGQIYLTLNNRGFDPEEFEIPAEIVEAVNLFDQELTVARDYLSRVVAAAEESGGG
jgi:pilus assembly protein CpaB